MSAVSKLLLFAALLATIVGAACSGDDGDGDETPSASGTARATSTARPAQTEGASSDSDATPAETPAPTDTPPSGATPPASAPTQPPSGSAPPPPPPPTGRVWTLAEAQALLSSAPLTPADLAGQWVISADVAQDNASAAAADPRAGASFERCGRLSGRQLVNSPVEDQVVSRYLGGESVSFFTVLTVYATSEGAADCAIENAVRFSEPGELAKAFGSVFVKTVPVTVTQVAYPAIGDGSISWTLAGKTSPTGIEVDIKIQIVAFRKGNVTAVVGVAAAFDPPVDELTPLVNTVLARIAAAQ